MDAEELPRNVSRRHNALDDKKEALFYFVESLGNVMSPVILERSTGLSGISISVVYDDHDDHLILY